MSHVRDGLDSTARVAFSARALATKRTGQRACAPRRSGGVAWRRARRAVDRRGGGEPVWKEGVGVEGVGGCR